MIRLLFVVFACCFLQIEAMTVTSSAFSNGDRLPIAFTCSGINISPPLSVQDIPAGTSTFAITVIDPDAPSGEFVHWLVWNIPVEAKEMPQGRTKGVQGTNGFGSQSYKGACPPPGKVHHYIFTVYALDQRLKLAHGATRGQLEGAMKGHILGTAQLTAVMER